MCGQGGREATQALAPPGIGDILPRSSWRNGGWRWQRSLLNRASILARMSQLSGHERFKLLPLPDSAAHQTVSSSDPVNGA